MTRFQCLIASKLRAIPRRLLLLALLAPLPGAAAVPTQLSYQGYLTDAAGAPIGAAVEIAFRLYDAASGGNLVWSETQSVTPEEGSYGVVLGSATPIDAATVAGGTLYMAVQVGTDAEMAPRQAVASAAFALRAAVAEEAEALAANGTDCAAGEFAQGVDAAGNAEGCTAATGTVSGVTADAPLASSGGATPNLSLGACADGQILKYGGSAWGCDVDADTNSGGTLTAITAGAGLTGGTITSSGTLAVDPDSTTLTGNFFKQGGNAFGATAVLGSTDSQGLAFQANGQTVLSISMPDPTDQTPNLVAGYRYNGVGSGVVGAVIAGGGALWDGADDERNTVYDDYCVIGGGTLNTCGSDDGALESAYYSVVVGGYGNTASGDTSTVGGGWENTASGYESIVAGGSNNTASGLRGVVGGGRGNTATGSHTLVGGGYNNIASGTYSAVGGGDSNVAGGTKSAVGGGYDNIAGGEYATIAGGFSNWAAGDYSFAAGHGANVAADHDGTFVFADAGSADDFISVAANEFAVRATGGVRFVTSATGNTLLMTTAIAADGSISSDTGASLTAGGVWTNASDRNLKENFTPVDAGAVLEKVAALPIQGWNYKSQAAAIRHLGPMAQDFHAAFGLGENDTSIGTVDADGVALAAIQGLALALREKEAEITALRERLAALERSQGEELAALRDGLAELRAGIASGRGSTGRVAWREER